MKTENMELSEEDIDKILEDEFGHTEGFDLNELKMRFFMLFGNIWKPTKEQLKDHPNCKIITNQDREGFIYSYYDNNWGSVCQQPYRGLHSMKLKFSLK